MLRLIGILVIVALIIGPICDQAGMLEHTGLLKELVGLEVRAFVDLMAWFRSFFHRE